MDHVCPKDIFWFCVKLNPSISLDPPSTQLKDYSNSTAESQFMRSCPSSDQLKDLLNLSAEKLVSDVCLLRHKISSLPEKIRSILLFKAISDGKILSVVELMKCCPYEEFKVPIPCVLKNYHVNMKQFAKDELKKHYDVAVTIFTTYINDIVKQRSICRLRVLDLGSAPVCSGWLINRLKDFLKMYEKLMKDYKSYKYRMRNPKNIKSVTEITRKATRGFIRVQAAVPRNYDPSKKFVLKCSILVEKNQQLAEIRECLAKLKSTSLEVTFSGVFFLNVFCQYNQVQDLVESFNQDSKLLSIMFSDFNPRIACLLNLIEKYKYLKYLNVSKLSLAQSQDLKPEFLTSLSRLTTLKRLVLRDVKLTGNLSLLLCNFCQQNSEAAVSRDCCLGHCGSLQYLDVSGCSLGYKDLKFLEQLSYSKSLKFLDISDNNLPVQSTCRTLLLFSSSLSVLHIAHGFDEYLEYDSETFPLSSFTQLRALSIGGMRPTLAGLKMLHSELEKINLNILKFDSEVCVGCHLACLDILIRAQTPE